MLTLVQALREHSRVSIFCVREGPLTEEARRLGIATYSPFADRPLPTSKTLRWWHCVQHLRQIIKAESIDLIHSHSAMGMRYAWPASGFTGVPVVCHQRDNFERSYFHLAFGRADRIVSISDQVYKTLPDHLKARAHVVHNAVDVSSIPDPLPVRRPGVLRVGAAGRGVPEKGFDLLLDAAMTLAGKCSFELHLWGPDPEATSGHPADLVRQGAALRERGVRVFQEPFRSDVHTFYELMDVIVVPSRYPEPFGRMAIEAMAWSRPLLVAGHGGLIEIVRNEENGLTHLPGNAADLARQLERLLSDETLRKRLSQNAAIDVRERFTPPAHADSVLHVYKKAIRSAR